MAVEILAGAGRSAPDRPVLPSLTGARWWAAFAVFVLHALVFLPVYPFQKSELFRAIHRAVPMQFGAERLGVRLDLPKPGEHDAEILGPLRAGRKAAE